MNNEDVKNNEMKIIHEELLKSLNNYRKTMSYLLGDAPIEVLCLPKPTQTALINAGCVRIYDLFDRDLTEIKGIGHSRIRDLTTCLDQFVSMC